MPGKKATVYTSALASRNEMSEIEILVEASESFEDYEEAWLACMSHVHWIEDRGPFDYHSDEELEEIQEEFDKPGNTFLVARLDDDDEIVGVLGVTSDDKTGWIKRWEPGVPPFERGSGVADALMRFGLSFLKDRGVERVGCRLRHPLDRPDLIAWHAQLYDSFGFKKSEPMSVTLLLDLSLSIPQPTPEDIVVKTLDDFTLEELSELIVTAFASTPEDRAIHGFDSAVTDYDKSLQIQQAIKNGKFGHSPADFWRIAVVDGEPAGLLIGMIPEFKHRPPFGIIGELGVSPNFRRIGVASLLVNQINQLFLEHGCQYSWVGTPETNRGGLELYQSLGFVPIIGLIQYEAIL